MAKPKRVKVGPHWFRIWWNNEAAVNADVAGAMMEQASIILLDPKISKTQRRETLVHECLHAMWSQTWMDKLWPDEDQDGDGERIIHTLAPILLGWLRDNPEVVEFLVQEEEAWQKKEE